MTRCHAVGDVFHKLPTRIPPTTFLDQRLIENTWTPSKENNLGESVPHSLDWLRIPLHGAGNTCRGHMLQATRPHLAHNIQEPKNNQTYKAECIYMHSTKGHVKNNKKTTNSEFADCWNIVVHFKLNLGGRKRSRNDPEQFGSDLSLYELMSSHIDPLQSYFMLFRNTFVLILLLMEARRGLENDPEQYGFHLS